MLRYLRLAQPRKLFSIGRTVGFGTKEDLSKKVISEEKSLELRAESPIDKMDSESPISISKNIDAKKIKSMTRPQIEEWLNLKTIEFEHSLAKKIHHFS